MPPTSRSVTRSSACSSSGAGSARRGRSCGELIADGQQLPRRTVGVAAGALGPRELWRGARVADQPGLCRRVRVRPHPPGEARSTTNGRAARQDARGADRAVVRLHARAPSRLCHLGGVPRQPRAAARERETARRGRRRRPRRRRAAAGLAALRTLRPADAGRLFRQRRPGRLGMRACARTTCTAPSTTCQSLGGGRLDKAVAAAFLEAVTPAGVAREHRRDRASSSEQHDAAARRPATRGRARRVRSAARASASSTRASRRTGSSRARWSASSKTRSPELEREQRKLAELEHAPTRAAHPSRARRARPGSRVICRSCGRRRRPPTVTARSCCAR